MPSALRHALRSLRRTPVFAVAAMVTLVLGIGSAAAMCTIVYGVLLAPLPYAHPDRLVDVGLDARSPERRHLQQPSGAYFTFRRFARRFDDVAFYRSGSGNIWTSATDQPERVTATWVTASAFHVLGVRPMLGRPFTSEEDRAHGPDVVVISASVWRTRFHAAGDVIGKTLQVNSVPRTVVGVMPDRFRFPDAETRIWLPAKLDRDGAVVRDFSYAGVARLAAGATPELAQRDLAAVLPRLAELFPRFESGLSTADWLAQTRPAPVVTPLRDAMTDGIARTLWLLAAAAALVLLVACANVANLLLIRADGRQLELAVREALGARGLRRVTPFLGESIVLSTTAGAGALVAAWGAVRALVAFGPADVPRLTELQEPHVGLVTVAFVAVVSLAAAIVCSVVPAFRLRGAVLSINLRDGARGGTAGRTRQHLRTAIAALQIAIALVVVAGSALLLRTFHRLYQEQPGFDTTNVVTLWTQLPFARYGDSASVAFYGHLVAAVRELPDVRAAGLTTRLPLGDGETRQQSFAMEGDGRAVSLPTDVIDDGYFAALRIPVVAGRVFQPSGVQRDGEVIISQRAAATLWRDPTGQAALGRRLMLAPSGPSYTVVGVVGDVRDHDLGTPPAAAMYVPQAVPIDATVPGARRLMVLVVRTAGPPASVVPAVRRIVRDLDPAVPIFHVEAMHDVVRASTARLSLALTLMSAAAAITLVLGAIGLYGVMAYTVALRTREIGVRVALGADPRALARAVATRGLVLIAVGVGAGLVLFAMVAPLLRAFLYGVTASDPLTLSGAVLTLVATGALASWLPARRAARVDPVEALRAE